MCLPLPIVEETRMLGCKILVVMNTVCLILAKIFIFKGVSINVKLKRFTKLIEGFDCSNLPYVLYVAGGMGVLVNSIGIYLSFRSAYKSHRVNIRTAMVWHQHLYWIHCLVVFAAGCILFAHKVNMRQSFMGGVLGSMKQYQTDAEVKISIDLMQMKFQCCGDKKYTDWFQITWIQPDFVDNNDPEERGLMQSGNYETDHVPFSCCKPNITRPCIFKHVHDGSVNFNYDYQKDLTLFKNGCRDSVQDHVLSTIRALHWIAIFTFFLNLLGLIAFRYLVTSMLEALDKGDPTLPGRGYICWCCVVLTDELSGNVPPPPPPGMSSPPTVTSTIRPSGIATSTIAGSASVSRPEPASSFASMAQSAASRQATQTASIRLQPP